jgi:hypothetical protein
MIAIDPKQIAEKFSRHGGAFDRGCADSYYHRPRDPHYFVGGTYKSSAIKCVPGTAEYEAYMMGYDYNEAHGDKKDWG